MDFEKKNRLRNLKVIISEAIMVLTVVIMVTVLAFLVSGYWIDSDFEVKRQGLLQIYSIPTGADVEIDGESSWLQRTNTSKVLLSGEHELRLSKEGYDSWQKTVKISDGLLYRIHYPRLFLNHRYTEEILDVAGTVFATISPNREYLLLINNTTEWSLVNLASEKLETKKNNVSNILSNFKATDDDSINLFDGNIMSAKWNKDSTRLILNIHNNEKNEWLMLDNNNIAHSVNLTKEFGFNFEEVWFFDHQANTLLALRDRDLYSIDASGKSVSSVLVTDVFSLDSRNNEIYFSATLNDAASQEGYYIGKIKFNDDKISVLKEVSSPVDLLVTRFYEDDYLVGLKDNLVTLYKLSDFEEVASYELSFNPDGMTAGRNGEFFVFYSGRNIATIDMEAKILTEWSVSGESFDWLDNSMIYSVAGGELAVYDFDGLNERTIAKNVSARFPVGITANRYLYYFSDDVLIREWLNPR